MPEALWKENSHPTVKLVAFSYLMSYFRMNKVTTARVLTELDAKNNNL